MQRLYSTFANGWPGYGLLVLRVACSIYLLYEAIPLPLEATVTRVTTAWLAVGAAFLLIIGYLTPVAGSVAALLELWQAHAYPQSLWPAVLSAAIAGSLTLLGPGARSIDARRYGRKRISLEDLKRGDH